MISFYLKEKKFTHFSLYIKNINHNICELPNQRFYNTFLNVQSAINRELIKAISCQISGLVNRAYKSN